MNRTSSAGTRLGVLTTSFVLATSIAISSCKKDEEPVTPMPEPVPQQTASSFPITTGSYWIYVHEQTDAAGNITMTGGTDSVYVEGDTIIGSHTYKKIRSVVLTTPNYMLWQTLQIVRDSAGYLVDPTGAYVEHTNFTDTLRYDDIGPGIVNAWYFMEHEDSSVTVPAGTFTTVDYKGHMYATDPGYPHGIPRYTHRIWADQVGLVQEVVYYYSQPGYVQRSLVDYHIQ